jgi:hypothetical protein
MLADVMPQRSIGGRRRVFPVFDLKVRPSRSGLFGLFRALALAQPYPGPAAAVLVDDLEAGNWVRFAKR